jgi:hypothetical protein
MGVWRYNNYTGDEWYDDTLYDDDDDVEYISLDDPCDLELGRPRRDKMYILRWNPGRSKRGDHGEASADANHIPF